MTQRKPIAESRGVVAKKIAVCREKAAKSDGDTSKERTGVVGKNSV